MTILPQLILHIGAGKTGSTSIQFALKRNGPLLAEQNAAYVGLMLEQVPGATRYDWCVEGQPHRFFEQPPQNRARVDDEVFQTIRDELERFGHEGVSRVVWSNEAFLPSSARIIRIAQRLVGAGLRLRIVCYLRRHDEWARSAYVQFALKGKHYPGPVRTFREWISTHPVAFAEQIETWRTAFPGMVELYNVDATDDAVAHFCAVCGIYGMPTLRANVAPSNASLAAYLVHNAQYDQPVMPDVFASLIAPMKISGPHETTVAPLEDLLPTTEDLVSLQDECRGDFDRLNHLLAEQGQDTLVFDAPKDLNRSATTWEMQRYMLQMIIALQKQVSSLQKQLGARGND